jgi:hypothetical protein
MRMLAFALMLALAVAGAPTASAAATPAVRSSGTFQANVDFMTLTATAAPNGRHCELAVQGALTFHGTVNGVAEGQTTAYVLAPCDEVLVVPPGTYRDTFRFTGTFAGTVNGSPTTGELTYFGITHPGGDINATIRLQGGSRAVLRADATVAVGGTYTGVAKP